MDRALGVALTGVGVLGYVAGVLVAYPGRALSLPAVMVGVALLAVGRGDRGDGADPALGAPARSDAAPGDLNSGSDSDPGDAERGGRGGSS